MTIFKEWLNWDKFNMNFIRNYKISIVKLKLRHVFISNCISWKQTISISTMVTHSHDSTHIGPNENMA
jgi:hypothetical protein